MPEVKQGLEFESSGEPEVLFDACFNPIGVEERMRLHDRNWRLFYVGVPWGQRPTDFSVWCGKATVRVQGAIVDSGRFDLYRLLPPREQPQRDGPEELGSYCYDLVKTSKQASRQDGEFILRDPAAA